MKKYNKRDWAEVGIVFLFLAGATIALGLVGALLMELIFRLI